MTIENKLNKEKKVPTRDLVYQTIVKNKELNISQINYKLQNDFGLIREDSTIGYHTRKLYNLGLLLRTGKGVRNSRREYSKGNPPRPLITPSGFGRRQTRYHPTPAGFQKGGYR